MNFSVLAEVRPHTESFPLEQANEAFARMMENDLRFRAGLTITSSSNLGLLRIMASAATPERFGGSTTETL